MNIKSVLFIFLCAISLFSISAITSAEGVKYKTTKDMIEDVYYDTNENTYMAETTKHWLLPLMKADAENVGVTVTYNKQYDGKIADIEYDNNGGSSNMEDWTMESWSLESR